MQSNKLPSDIHGNRCKIYEDIFKYQNIESKSYQYLQKDVYCNSQPKQTKETFIVPHIRSIKSLGNSVFRAVSGKKDSLLRYDDTDNLDKLSAYPEPNFVEYMEHQSQLFEKKRKELLNQYEGMYVIFEDGQVLDADKDEAALVKRAYSETGPRHLFIKKVLTEDPKLTINVPSLSK